MSDETVPIVRLTPRALGGASEPASSAPQPAAHDTDDDVADEPPPLEHITGRTPTTGDTSRTSFVGPVIQEARRRHVELEEALGDTNDTDIPATGGLPRWLTRGAPLLLLAAVIVTSWLLLDLDQPRSKPSSTPAQATSDLPPQSTVELGHPATPELLSPGLSVPALLSLDLEVRRPGQALAFIKLGRDVAHRRQVTVLNLWATFCEPCKRELPDLKAMFEESGWGRRVRFASILSQDSTDPEEAHRRFADQMPANGHFLAEVTEGAASDALRRDLQAATDRGAPLAAQPGAIKGLPITLVLDCKQELRLVYARALEPGHIEELRRNLDRLADELKEPRCQPPPPPTKTTVDRTNGTTTDATTDSSPSEEPASQTAPTPRATKCGDGRCEPPAETCSSCLSDCPCSPNEKCDRRTDGHYDCIYDALK